MQNNPLVSVIICTYNGAAFIHEQLQTIVAQTYHPLEIIVADDGSTDDTLDIVETFIIENEKLRVYVNETNLGYNKNFEKAALLAHGEYIAFADQDDIWELNKIECLMKCWQLPDTLMVTCESATFRTGNPPDMKGIKRKQSFSGNDAKSFFLYNHVSGHNMLIKKQLLLQSTPFPKNIYYDWWLCMVACANGRIQASHKVLVYHRMHEQSATTKALVQKHPSALVLERLPILLTAPNLCKVQKQIGVTLIERFSKLQQTKFCFKTMLLIFKNGKSFFCHKKKLFPYFSYLKHAYRWSRNSTQGLH